MQKESVLVEQSIDGGLTILGDPNDVKAVKEKIAQLTTEKIAQTEERMAKSEKSEKRGMIKQIPEKIKILGYHGELSARW